MIELYFMPESPPCSVVLMVLDVLKLPFKSVHVDLSKGEHYLPNILELNPLHTVPILKLDSKRVLLESRAIITFLIDEYGTEEGHGHLYPKDRYERARVDQLLYYDGCRLYPAQSQYLSPLLSGNVPDAAQQQKFYDCLKHLDTLLSSNNYLTGPSMTLADISIAGGLMFARAARFDFSKWPRLQKWFESMQQWPSYSKTVPEALIRFTGYIDSRKPKEAK